jgi:hypothetical protein
MDAVSRDISKIGLQIAANQKIKLTKGQSALLKSIRQCVTSEKPLDWGIIIDSYGIGVRKTYPKKEYKRQEDIILLDGSRHWQSGYYEETGDFYNIKDEYLNDTNVWRYTLRGLVRSWFLATIGILVIKNQLIVIPTIEIE